LPSSIKSGSIKSSLDLENVTSPLAQANDAARTRGGRPAPLACFEDSPEDEKRSESSGESGAENEAAVASAGMETQRPESKTPRASLPCSLPPGLSPPRHLKQADRDLPVAATSSAPALALPGILSTVPSTSPVAAGATAAPQTWTPTSASAVGKSVSTQTASTQFALDAEGGRDRSSSEDSCSSSFSRDDLLRMRAPSLRADGTAKEAAPAVASPELIKTSAEVAEA